MTILGRSEVACPRVEEAKWPGTNSRKGADVLAYNMYTRHELAFYCTLHDWSPCSP